MAKSSVCAPCLHTRSTNPLPPHATRLTLALFTAQRRNRFQTTRPDSVLPPLARGDARLFQTRLQTVVPHRPLAGPEARAPRRGARVLASPLHAAVAVVEHGRHALADVLARLPGDEVEEEREQGHVGPDGRVCDEESGG